MSTACAPEPALDVGEPTSCETVDKNVWVYDVMQENYLWNALIPELDPTTFATPEELLREIRYSSIDRWSRISDKTTTNALFMEGKAVGTGMRILWDAQDRLRIATVQEGTPAATAGLRRGDEILTVGGLTLPEIEEQDVWDEVWGANDPGVSFTAEVRSIADASVRSVVITREWIDLITVPDTAVLEHAGRPIGYLHFTSFLGPSDVELSTAFKAFKAAGARELVVDLRYNGGGLVAIAKYLMDLLAASANAGEIAYTVNYNENLVDLDRVVHLDRQSESVELDRVVFLVTGSTASASELVVNAVQAHLPVALVGRNTAGKPVGSNLFEFCDSILSPITFELQNADRVGGYFEGLPTDCEASDDVDHPLGDPSESMMAQALALLDTGTCVPVSTEREAGSSGTLPLRTSPPRPAPLRTRSPEELRGWM